VEDIELGYRLRQSGKRIRLDNELQVKHQKTWTFWSSVKTDFLNRALPWTELLLRERRFCADLNLDHRIRASVLRALALSGACVLSLLFPQVLVVSLTLALTAGNKLASLCVFCASSWEIVCGSSSGYALGVLFGRWNCIWPRNSPVSPAAIYI